ncbi:Holliday junction branch migration protein RuvA [Methyloceanibacter superfactus]|uniref:Holliday junction branch migration protein RuvA n=1 Tax=Methyloceanibacter superfactus TaxID=1774969 RepID=UPI000A4034C7
MIGKLTGKVDTVSLSTAIIDVGGVGYEVTLGTRTLSTLPPIGEVVTLAIDTHLKEDGVRLYGFTSEHDRAWFRACNSVQGVGAKVALAVLGTLSANDLANAVALQDKNQVRARLASAPRSPRGSSPSKTRCRRWRPPRTGRRRHPGGGVAGRSRARDAVSALTNLGYAHGEAAAAVSAAIAKMGNEARAEELIRVGLKELAQ